MNKEYEINIDDQSVTFEFKDSLIHAEGDHAGDIDAIITTSPPLPQELLLDELHIKVPDTDEYLYIYGYGAVENSLKATFNSSKIVDKNNLPDKVDVFWGANGEQYIGEMNCMPYSEKIEHNLDDEVLSQDDLESADEPQEELVKEEEESKELKNKPSSYYKWLVASVFFIVLVIMFIALL